MWFLSFYNLKRILCFLCKFSTASKTTERWKQEPEDQGQLTAGSYYKLSLSFENYDIQLHFLHYLGCGFWKWTLFIFYQDGGNISWCVCLLPNTNMIPQQHLLNNSSFSIELWRLLFHVLNSYTKRFSPLYYFALKPMPILRQFISHFHPVS